jgi:4-diphosphocytidyl-2-C-methyl-D-erythritol kinase
MLSALAPAKINLYLCVLGRREDGFHALSSLIAPLAFGDELELETVTGSADQLCCNDASLMGPDNLVSRALVAFRQQYPAAPFFRVKLTKKIPVGAGLGGGSSDAATVLRLANSACGNPLAADQLTTIAAAIGSDCPVFLQPCPSYVSGRGEILQPAAESLLDSLAGRRLIVFKPPFSIATPWAYQCLSRRQYFSDVSEAAALQVRWAALARAGKIDPSLLRNDFERVICERHLALHTLLADLRRRMQAPVLMSGSGSACFVVQPDASDKKVLREALQTAFGDGFFWIETMLQGNKT